MSEYLVKSTYGTDVPPWSAMEIISIANESGRSVYSVTRPTKADLPAGKVLFSGACSIPAGGYGIGYSAFDGAVFANGTPDGTTGYCGVAANSFDLSGTQSGFVSPGGSGKIAVRPFSSAAADEYYVMPEIYWGTDAGQTISNYDGTSVETQMGYFRKTPSSGTREIAGGSKCFISVNPLKSIRGGMSVSELTQSDFQIYIDFYSGTAVLPRRIVYSHSSVQEGLPIDFGYANATLPAQFPVNGVKFRAIADVFPTSRLSVVYLTLDLNIGDLKMIVV